MLDFQIATEEVEPGIVVLFIKGPLNSDTAEELSHTLNDFFARRVYKFIVDLSGVNYIGSAGIGVFISVLDILEQNSGTIVFIHPNPKVKEVFKIFKLSTFYSITSDRAGALKELRMLCKPRT